MSKQVLKKPTRKISDALLVVTLLLPVILYVVYIWRSGAFADVSDFSSVFRSGLLILDTGELQHTPASFGEFFNSNFVISELNSALITPIVAAVREIAGSISPQSAYLIYSICGYLTYIMVVYFAILIFKLVTFIPCVVINLVNKATGGDSL